MFRYQCPVTPSVRVGVEAGGATVGELVMIVSLMVARDWNFKLVRRGEEVLRVGPDRAAGASQQPSGAPRPLPRQGAQPGARAPLGRRISA